MSYDKDRDSVRWSVAAETNYIFVHCSYFCDRCCCSILDGFHFMGGLQRLADDLKCLRLGAEHQAGSDSLLTMSVYFALVQAKFTGKDGKVDDSKYANELFGYGTNHTVRKPNSTSTMNRDASAGSILSSGSND